MALYGGGCGRFFESRRSNPGWAAVPMTIGAGQILSSRPRDCSPCIQPGSWRANPDEETTDWRAVCGRTARTVRRAGTAGAVSDPYRSAYSEPLRSCRLRQVAFRLCRARSWCRSSGAFIGRFVGLSGGNADRKFIAAVGTMTVGLRQTKKFLAGHKLLLTLRARDIFKISHSSSLQIGVLEWRSTGVLGFFLTHYSIT